MIRSGRAFFDAALCIGESGERSSMCWLNQHISEKQKDESKKQPCERSATLSYPNTLFYTRCDGHVFVFHRKPTPKRSGVPMGEVYDFFGTLTKGIGDTVSIHLPLHFS